MKNHTTYRNVISVVLSLTASIIGLASAFAADVPQSFTLDGRLFSDASATTPLQDGAIGFTVQILDEAKLCVLYEESQTLNTLSSKGYFSAQVGTVVGSPLRTPGDSANSMATVFQNISLINGKLLSNGGPCTVPATGGSRRYVRIKILPPTMGGSARTLSPDLNIDSVPNAVVAERAETLQGLRATNVLQVNTASGSALSQTNLESLFSSTARFNALTAVVDGTSTSYMRSNSSAGALLPVISGAPTGPVPGSVWYDSVDSKMKYQTSVGPITLGTGGGSVTSVGFTAPSELAVTGAPITSSGTIAVTWATQTTNKVLAAPDGSTGTPTFRVLTANDIPSLPWTKITSLLPTTLLGYGITDAVKNAGGTPSIQSGLNAAKGAASTAGRVWISTDTKEIYSDNGTSWDLIGRGSGGGTVTSVSSVNAYLSVATATTTPALTVNVGTAANTVAAGDDSRITGALQTTAYNADVAPAALCTTSQTPYWNTVSDTWACQNINVSSAGGFFKDGGNSFGGNASLGTNDNFNLSIKTNNTTQMTVLANGNVGIGTSMPGSRLEVVSAASYMTTALFTNSSSMGTAALRAESTAATGSSNGLWASTASSDPNAVAVYAASSGNGFGVYGRSGGGIPGFFQSWSVGNTSPSLVTRQFSTGAADLFQAQNAAGVSLFNISSTGSVGIGTATPAAPLDVAGDVKVGNSSATCSVTNKGSIRYNNVSSVLEFCNGTAWNLVQAAACTDPTPNVFSFANQANATASTLYTSDIVQVAGINCSVPVTISGQGTPQYQICSDAACVTVVQAWTSGASSITNGQYLQTRLTTDTVGGAQFQATIIVGSGATVWSVTNAGGDCTLSPAVGTVCADGTIYVGLSPDTSVKMFTTRCDLGQTWDGINCTGSRTALPWNNGTGSWTVTGYTSSVAGKSNSAGIAALVDAGSPYQAAQNCENLNINGKTDWYLPALSEVNVMYSGKAAIRNFDTSGTYYWSSTEGDNSSAYVERFSDGYQTRGYAGSKYNPYLVRCVRR